MATRRQTKCCSFLILCRSIRTGTRLWWQKLKRFCCSSCPYRSNFRSDVVRHIRHKHPTVACASGISKLDAASAAATLDYYMNTWAKKKFVLHTRRNCRRPPQSSTSLEGAPTTASSPRHGAAAPDSAHSVTLPTIDHAPSTSPKVVSLASPEGCALENQLVMDIAREDCD